MNFDDASEKRHFIVLLGGEIHDITPIGAMPQNATVIAADSGLHLRSEEHTSELQSH